MDLDDIFIPHLIYMAEHEKHEHSAIQLLKIVREGIERGEPMPETIRPYLVEALTKIVDHGESAGKAFNLERSRGEKKETVHYRNVIIAAKVAGLMRRQGISQAEAIRELSKEKHSGDGCQPTKLGIKAFEDICSKHLRKRHP